MLAASTAAGPIFVTPIFITAAWWGPGHVTNRIPLLIAPLILSLPVGFLLSVLPHLLATSLLARIGRDNIGVRFWPFWALAGAGLGWAIDWAAALFSGTGVPGPMVALIGIPCALICRWGTRWSD